MILWLKRHQAPLARTRQTKVVGFHLWSSGAGSPNYCASTKDRMVSIRSWMRRTAEAVPSFLECSGPFSSLNTRTEGKRQTKAPTENIVATMKRNNPDARESEAVYGLFVGVIVNSCLVLSCQSENNNEQHPIVVMNPEKSYSRMS